MKKTLIVVGLILLLGAQVIASIVGSDHDLRGNPSFGNTQEICKVCHVPHKSTAPSYLGTRSYSGSVTFYEGSIGSPTNSSAICISCHDGTLAPSVGPTQTDFTHSHPFSVAYPVGSTGYASPIDGQIVGTYGTLKLESPSEDMVECGTCHDPHSSGTSGHYLRIENTDSNLCLTCHQK